MDDTKMAVEESNMVQEGNTGKQYEQTDVGGYENEDPKHLKDAATWRTRFRSRGWSRAMVLGHRWQLNGCKVTKWRPGFGTRDPARCRAVVGDVGDDKAPGDEVMATACGG